MPSAVPKSKPHTRRSSPQVRQSTPKTTVNAEEWTEPAVKTRASYEDTGGIAAGVLEDMLPLGLAPSAKVKARVRAEPLRKSLGKNLGLSQEYGTSPEGTPAVETPRSVSAVPEEAVQLPVMPVEDVADEDYQPQAAKKTQISRKSRASTGASESKAASPAVAVPPTSAQQPQPTELTAAPPADVKSTDEIDQANLAAIIDTACARASELNKEDFGAAIRQVYTEGGNHHLLRNILLHTATDTMKEEFRTIIARARRTVRKARSSDASHHVEVNGSHAPGEQAPPSREPSERPELVPRPSIEKAVETPKIRISVRDRMQRKEDNGLQPETPVNGEGRATRSTSHLSHDATSSAQKPAAADGDGQGMNGTQANSHAKGDAIDNTSVQADVPVIVEQGVVRDTKASISHTGQLDDGDIKMGDDGQPEAQLTRPPKRSPAEAGLAPEEDRIELTKRRKLRETIYKEPGPAATYPQSHVRQTPESTRSLRTRAPETQQPIVQLSNGAPPTPRARRGREASDSPLSDMSTTPPPVENPPTDLTAPQSTQKAKTKHSPEKKRQVFSSMEGRGGRAGSVDDEGEESDNSDYCTSCGGPGKLLCCDGCDRAFHFNCVDPPLDDTSLELNEPWFCHSCVAKRKPPPRQPRGLFAALLQGLDKKNSVVFTLPEMLRNYYVNVNTGKDGKFEEINNAKTRSSRVGIEEPMDLGKTKDSKGQTVLCFHCGRSAAGKRPIIACDVCGNWWHLDCTDPPLANPPCRDQWGRKVRDWMCPLHIEHDLSAMDPLRLARQRKFHLRRPKNAKVSTTALRRGQVNNGMIEVADDSSSSDDDFDDIDDIETDSGTIVRLPAKGIKLDFIDKVHRTRTLEAEGDLPPPKRTRINSSYLRATLHTRPVIERRTLLSLVQLASEQKDIDITGNAIENLIDTMTAEAPTEVIESVTRDEDVDGGAVNGINGLVSPAGSQGGQVDGEERKQLEALRRMIERKLAEGGVAP